MCVLSFTELSLCLAEILESSTSRDQAAGQGQRGTCIAREGEGGKRAGGGGGVEETGGATSRKRRGGEALDIEAPAIQNPAPSRNVVSK